MYRYLYSARYIVVGLANIRPSVEMRVGACVGYNRVDLTQHTLSTVTQ